MINVIVPTFNEKKSIEQFLIVLKKEMKKKRFKVIIVDDSTDGTNILARKICNNLNLNYKIIHRVNSKGKGGAINEGLKELREGFGVIIDADLEYHPKYIFPMIKRLKDYDFITSVRVRKDKWYRRVLGFFFKFFVFLLFNIPFETQSGLKVFKVKSIKGIDLISKGWIFDVELIKKVMNNGFKVGTFNVYYNTRDFGRSKISFFTPFNMFFDLLILKLHNFK